MSLITLYTEAPWYVEVGIGFAAWAGIGFVQWCFKLPKFLEYGIFALFFLIPYLALGPFAGIMSLVGIL